MRILVAFACQFLGLFILFKVIDEPFCAWDMLGYIVIIYGLLKLAKHGKENI
jgi:hypothetical protein